MNELELQNLWAYAPKGKEDEGDGDGDTPPPNDG